MSEISIKDLKFSYDGCEKAIDGISLEIEEGTFTGIVGESGCGKSTLCGIICGIIPSAAGGIISGRVITGGVDIRETSLKDMAQIAGFVMQDSDRQIVSSTVEDELAFGPENLCVEVEEIRKRVDEVAKLLHIEHILEENPNNLSGGQKQLVAIGSVLTLNPGILVLDEPSSHLDRKGRENLLILIERLKAMGKTVIMVEHDHHMVEGADRRICIKDGRIEREY